MHAPLPHGLVPELVAPLRIRHPIGVYTIIQECVASPWTDVPLHHPFAEIASLSEIACGPACCRHEATRACVVGIVSYQPGVVERSFSHWYSLGAFRAGGEGVVVGLMGASFADGAYDRTAESLPLFFGESICVASI